MEGYIKDYSTNLISWLNFFMLPKPKDIISKVLGTILTAFEDVNQMEVIKVRWEEIKKLQPQLATS